MQGPRSSGQRCMYSAELLARLELRCRELVRDLSESKYARDSASVRPYLQRSPHSQLLDVV